MEIDFVIPWVDNRDPAWIKRFNQYSPQKKDLALDLRAERYDDNGLLRYWFRGVEKNAPWVRKIFFITDGQKPAWLNLNNPKLVWIQHDEYIPQNCLPVFSSHPIEMYIHRITGLSDRFVYFNDDMYLIQPVQKSFFFKDGLPCDSAIIKCISPDYFAHIQINDLIEINKHFHKSAVIHHYFDKFFNGKYSFWLQCMSLFFCTYKKFLGFYVSHTPQPYLKNTFTEVWNHCEEVLTATAMHKFRNIADVNQYLFKYWQLVTGNFAPVNLWAGKRYFEITSKNIKTIEKTFHHQHIKTICLNDTTDSAEYYPQVASFFEKKFPDPSGFEQ